MKLQRDEIISFVGGLILSVGLGTLMHIHNTADQPGSHPVADPFDTEYHAHADFHIMVNDTLVDLSGDQFQTTSQQELHQHVHLHDNNSDAMHIHDTSVTFAQFLGALGIKLTDQCITFDNEYCSNQTNQLQLYVNDELYTNTLTQYIPVDDDRLLLYYGTPDNPALPTYLTNVPNDACYYSGTCPERGVAPDENCGLSCEL